MELDSTPYQGNWSVSLWTPKGAKAKGNFEIYYGLQFDWLANFGKKPNETIPKFITQLQNHQNKSETLETLETRGQVESER